MSRRDIYNIYSIPRQCWWGWGLGGKQLLHLHQPRPSIVDFRRRKTPPPSGYDRWRQSPRLSKPGRARITTRCRMRTWPWKADRVKLLPGQKSSRPTSRHNSRRTSIFLSVALLNHKSCLAEFRLRGLPSEGSPPSMAATSSAAAPTSAGLPKASPFGQRKTAGIDSPGKVPRS